MAQNKCIYHHYYSTWVQRKGVLYQRRQILYSPNSLQTAAFAQVLKTQKTREQWIRLSEHTKKFLVTCISQRDKNITFYYFLPDHIGTLNKAYKTLVHDWCNCHAEMHSTHHLLCLPIAHPVFCENILKDVLMDLYAIMQKRMKQPELVWTSNKISYLMKNRILDLECKERREAVKRKLVF